MLRRLVVGVDGTDASARALDWAASTVGPEGTLHCVAAASPMIEFGVDVITGDPVGYLDFLERHLAGDWTRRIVDRVAKCTVELREQRASLALTEAAVEVGADGIVIGSHHHRSLSVGVIGRTTRGLLRQLPTALIIVPEGAQQDLGGDGPIVVALGHGEATEGAVWWASQLADDRDLPIGLVRTTGDAPVFQANGFLDLLGYYLSPADREAWTTRDVTRFAHAVQENSDHTLSVDVDVRAGLPAVQLVEASRTAGILVVGQHWSAISRGHHVSQPLRYLLGHAAGVVAVVPEAAVHVP
jgi:nucleotide-binding universal stress UspA family protein